MFSDVLQRQRSGEALPEGVAIDAQGNPTTDAASVHAVLPFGGYKGFALALAVEALGVFAGASDRPDKKDGYVIIAIKPDLFVPLDEYRRQLSNTIRHIKETPRHAGVDEIRIPSERAFRERARSLREGIVIDRSVYEALRALNKEER